MKKLSPNDSLDQAIDLLELERRKEFDELRLQSHQLYENMKPINLIKSAIEEVTTSPDVQKGVEKAAMGATAGFLVKSIVFRKSHNPLKILASIALQTIATSMAVKHSSEIKSTGQKFFDKLRNIIKRKEESNEVRKLNA